MQVEAEIKPFKGILLSLFFLCTGAAVDVPILLHNFPTILLLTVGLISVKFAITAIAARNFGLTEAESVKVALTLSQGGEFAFVLLALAQARRPSLCRLAHAACPARKSSGYDCVPGSAPCTGRRCATAHWPVLCHAPQADS